MVAATKDRDTQQQPGHLRGFPLAAVKVFAGTIAALDTVTGYLTKGATSANLKCMGVFDRPFDNSAGAAGDVIAETKLGVFGPFANSAAADQITNADINSQCFIVDDQTVAKTSNAAARSVAGTVYQVDPTGVWVRFG